MSQPFKRYAVQKLYEARPTVAQQVAEIVAKQQGEQAARLLLPEPSFMVTPNKAGTPNPSFSPEGDVGGMRQRISPTE